MVMNRRKDCDQRNRSEAQGVVGLWRFWFPIFVNWSFLATKSTRNSSCQETIPSKKNDESRLSRIGPTLRGTHNVRTRGNLWQFWPISLCSTTTTVSPHATRIQSSSVQMTVFGRRKWQSVWMWGWTMRLPSMDVYLGFILTVRYGIVTILS